MRFKSFTIKNFKGIQACTIEVENSSSNVFCLVGLNESGKTTILQAINYFVATDVDLQKIYDLEAASVNKADFVPKGQKANFNGEVRISAQIEIEEDDVSALASAWSEVDYKIDYDHIPQSIKVTQYFSYENTNYVKSGRYWDASFKAIKKGSKKSEFVDAKHPAWSVYHTTLLDRIPKICYFPTFLFELPDRIYIEEKSGETPANAYYRRLIQDVLDSLDNDLNIQTHIIDRIRGKSNNWTWFSFLQTDQREQVNHVLLRASAKVTRVIMDSWKKVFNRNFDNKRIELEYGHDEAVNAIYIKMYIIDGSEKYDIGDRSLGFRWFFCFWLFTYFRTLRMDSDGIVFLLDEPASNLHARAQEELLSNMKSLAGDRNIVMYSTHSHYLINPVWLDSAYIVSNGALNYDGIEDEFLSSGETNISATKYKKFVQEHSNKRTYFLPVLDALDYKPSEMTMEKSSLLVEGKADFAFLKMAWQKEGVEFSVIPGNGAKSMDPLIGLTTGWGVSVAILLDDDREGREAKASYRTAWGLSDQEVTTLKKFNAEFSGKSLEDILLVELKEQVATHFDMAEPEKFHVQAYLYEMMAKSADVELSDVLRSLASDVLIWARTHLTPPIS